MPIYYLRRLSGDRRTSSANKHLGYSLAFIAGAINAGGFLAVERYTSHMTGIVSSLADNLVTNELGAVLVGLGSLTAFIAGSAYSAILISWGRHHRMHSKYAYPLLWEAMLLLCFGLMGGSLELHQSAFIPVTVMLLCFIMGLQNAIISKISNSEIRTTHMTGIVTDIGIELGKAFYINSQKESAHYQPVRANRSRLAVLSCLLLSFLAGGVAGALGFKYVGYASTIPLAVFLVFLAIVPLVDDARTRFRVFTRQRLH
ncbi:putative transmembrane protein [Paramagnetospirillum magnetotacticum MS-1]|uniref:Putative transmembrane protein n=1 Tax=Paramagnetospirillum magnetotacticum MS-1 TaxID=272627 RepID=A0A0C2YKG7_PARME|nr:YoaK family protein [Paramagnetospirillum magnetotacticum]KIM00270.1 putative transmembrane protein [Paramagnetospirillum magnetotacticum MS-1]